MAKFPEASNSKSLIRALAEKSKREVDREEVEISREWSEIDLLGVGGSWKAPPTGSSSPFRGRRKKRLKPNKFADTEKEFYQGKTEERGHEKSISPIQPPPGPSARGRPGYMTGRDQIEIAVLVPAEKFHRLRPRQTSPGTIEYLAMRIERLRVEPSKNILDLILIRRPYPMMAGTTRITK